MTIRLVRHMSLAQDESRRVTLSDVEEKLRALGGSAESLAKDAAPPTIGALVAAGGAGGGLRSSRSAASEHGRTAEAQQCVATSIAGCASWSGAGFDRG